MLPLLPFDGSKPVDGADGRAGGLCLQKGAKRPDHGADETVAMPRERLVGREHQTPVCLGSRVRLRVEWQVVPHVLGHDGSLESLGRGEQVRVAQLAEGVVLLDGDDVMRRLAMRRRWRPGTSRRAAASPEQPLLDLPLPPGLFGGCLVGGDPVVDLLGKGPVVAQGSADLGLREGQPRCGLHDGRLPALVQ